MVAYLLTRYRCSDGPLETPRALSRFPLATKKYGQNTSESESASEMRSPGFAKPPLPARSHYRVPSSQNVLIQNAALRRPGLAPLTLGNERNRSNSESVLQATQNTRNKRMGMVPKKQTDLTILDETRVNRNSYHLRGQSHGSALRQGLRGGHVSPSNTLSGSEDQRGILGRPLSSLPRQRLQDIPRPKIIETAQGILYSLNLVHQHLSVLFPVIKEEKSKRSSLERVYHNAAIRVEHLDQELSKCMRDAAQGLGFTDASRRTVRQATHACILTHQPMAQLLTRSVGQLAEDADPKYLRTLMLLLYGSLNEIFNSNQISGRDRLAKKAQEIDVKEVTHIKATPSEAEPSRIRDHSVTPTRDRPKPERRWRNGGSIQQPSSHIDLHVALGTQTAVPLYLNGRSRSNSRTGMLHSSSANSAVSTPRSGESFSSARLAPRSRSGSVTTTFATTPEQARMEKEQRLQFEQIFIILKKSAEQGLQIIPQLQSFFKDAAEASQRQYTHEKVRELWLTLVNRNRMCLSMSEKLKKRLSIIKLNDPEARNARDFWRLVKGFVDSYSSLLASLREARLLNLVPSDMRHQVRPVHKFATEAASLITNSPWNRLTFEVEPQTRPPSLAPTPAPTGYQAHRTRGSGGSNAAASSSPYTPSVPATPLSAALGPAAQATVPATPASASLNRSFEGDVFQRADSLLSMQNAMYQRR